MVSKKMISLFFVLAIVEVAFGVPYNLNGCWVEVDYWAGSGSNETIIVIDWNQTNGPYITESHAWGFRWDGTAYLSDALAAIDAAGALDITTSYGGAFLSDAFYYDPSIDSDNHTSAGYSGWWWLGETTDCGATWIGNEYGLTEELLGHGKIEGMNMDSGVWTSDTLTIPIPEPMAIAMLAVGGLLVRRRKAFSGM